jgi:hypothetical protein
MTTKNVPSPRFSVEPGSEPGLTKFVIELPTSNPMPAIETQTIKETTSALFAFFAVNTLNILTALNHEQLGQVVYDIICGGTNIAVHVHVVSPKDSEEETLLN